MGFADKRLLRILEGCASRVTHGTAIGHRGPQPIVTDKSPGDQQACLRASAGFSKQKKSRPRGDGPQVWEETPKAEVSNVATRVTSLDKASLRLER
jgi:hypothetical protein